MLPHRLASLHVPTVQADVVACNDKNIQQVDTTFGTARQLQRSMESLRKVIADGHSLGNVIDIEAQGDCVGGTRLFSEATFEIMKKCHSKLNHLVTATKAAVHSGVVTQLENMVLSIAAKTEELTEFKDSKPADEKVMEWIKAAIPTGEIGPNQMSFAVQASQCLLKHMQQMHNDSTCITTDAATRWHDILVAGRMSVCKIYCHVAVNNRDSSFARGVIQHVKAQDPKGTHKLVDKIGKELYDTVVHVSDSDAADA